jgi:hypothetical protein
LADVDGRVAVIGVTDHTSINDGIWPAFQHDLAPSALIDYAQDVSSRVLAHVGDLPPRQPPDLTLARAFRFAADSLPRALE